MLKEAVRLAMLLFVLAGVLFYGFRRTDPAQLVTTAAHGPDDFRLLIVGESWACDGKLFPELPDAISQRLGGRSVRACSLCFPGRSTKLLYTELLQKLTKDSLYEQCGGGRPDKVIFLNGVNDEIQHVGERNYVEYTRKLFDWFADIDDRENVAIPRVNEINFRSPYLFSRIKRRILMCWFDDCEFSANDKYRIAFWRDHPELKTIEFDNFIATYRGHEDCYLSDGVHLTEDCYHKYGAFIGKTATLDALERKFAGR